MTDITEYKKFLWEIAEFTQYINDELDKRIDSLHSLISSSCDTFNKEDDNNFIKVTPASKRQAKVKNTFNRELQILVATIEDRINANSNNKTDWQFKASFFDNNSFHRCYYINKIIDIYRQHGYIAYYNSTCECLYISIEHPLDKM